LLIHYPKKAQLILTEKRFKSIDFETLFVFGNFIEKSGSTKTICGKEDLSEKCISPLIKI
jgi:hypothetical protein